MIAGPPETLNVVTVVGAAAERVEGGIKKALRRMGSEKIGIADGNRVIGTHLLHKTLHNIIQEGRVRIGSPKQMRYRLGSLLVVADHVHVDHGENVLSIVGMGVEVGDDSEMFRPPHEANRAARTGYRLRLDKTVKDARYLQRTAHAGHVIP